MKLAKTTLPFFLALAGPTQAAPPTHGVRDGQITFDGEALESPCTASAVAVEHGRLYAACGAAGLGVFDLAADGAPTFAGFQDVGGAVTGLHRAGGRVWIEISRVEARPLEVAARTVAAAPGAATPARPRAEGSVLDSELGVVRVDFGATSGVERGDHVAFFLRHEVALGEGQTTIEEERLAVGEVTAVTETRARIRLGLDERVPPGAGARATEAALSESRLNPPRVDGVLEAGFVLRPFLAVGAFGFGTVSDVWGAYRFELPLRVLALVEPLGLGWADEGNVVAVAGNVFGTYDTRLFEIGLGAGWSAVNDRLDSAVAADDRGPGGVEPGFDEVESGLSISQLARLGATDGLHLVVRNNFLLADDTFHYGGTVAEGQFPVSARSWLLLRGGGGRVGYGFGELGLRWLAVGNGDAGSLFLSVTAGGALLMGREERTADDGTKYTEEVDYGGPLVGFGMEWRR